MVRGPLVPNSRRGHDDVSDGQVLVEHARPSAGDELLAAEGDQFFEQEGGQRRTDAGVEHPQSPPIQVKLVQGVRPDLGVGAGHDLWFVLLDQPGNHVVEEAQQAVLRHVRRLNVGSWFEDGLAVW